MYNTIILLKGAESFSRREYKKFKKCDTILGIDNTAIELMRWNIKDKEEAEKELAKHKCDYLQGINVVQITEYALEYCECDEDGEFISGSDYDFAEEQLYVADRETGTFIDAVDSVEEGNKLIAQYEQRDKVEGTYEEDFYDIVDSSHCTIQR